MHALDMAPATCTHGAERASTTFAFAWYADGCAVTPAAARRGEAPTPRMIVAAVSS